MSHGALHNARPEAGGVTAHRGIAVALNAREIPSPRGKRWNEIQAARLRRRLRPAAAPSGN